MYTNYLHASYTDVTTLVCKYRKNHSIAFKPVTVLINVFVVCEKINLICHLQMNISAQLVYNTNHTNCSEKLNIGNHHET
jgi:hypothetical protein